jgi:hypothetical protein
MSTHNATHLTRLVIANNSLPDVWFKDEGGRDKCIELNIALRDHNDDVIVERKVPLKVVLLYADGNVVLKQEILKISPDSKLHLGMKFANTSPTKMNMNMKMNMNIIFFIFLLIRVQLLVFLFYTTCHFIHSPPSS